MTARVVPGKVLWPSTPSQPGEHKIAKRVRNWYHEKCRSEGSDHRPNQYQDGRLSSLVR